MTNPEPNRKWRSANPEKVRAHWTVQNALRAGTLTRQPCEECGAQRVHAHHEDYSQPLAVTWLCAAHHRARHPQPSSRTRPHRPRKAFRIDQETARRLNSGVAATLRAKGLSYQEIASQLGATKGTVYKWLNATPYN